MGEPTLQTNIKLTPGNRTQKGRRSAPKAEARQTGKEEPYAYILKDPRVPEMPVLNSANGWWAEKIYGPVKLQKLVDAYCFYYTDEEAISYAGITLDNLRYFQKLHPDFYIIKGLCKAQPDMHAKKKLVETVAKDVNWAAWWISRTQKDTFGSKAIPEDMTGREIYAAMTERFKKLTEDIINDNEIDAEEYPNVIDAEYVDAGQDGARHDAQIAAPNEQGSEATA